MSSLTIIEQIVLNLRYAAFRYIKGVKLKVVSAPSQCISSVLVGPNN